MPNFSKIGPLLEGIADTIKGTKVADALGKPIEVYHGSANPIVGPIKSPAFFTSDKHGASWYAKNRGDGTPTIHKAMLNIKNPLDVSNKQGAMKLIDHAREAGVHVNVNDPGNGAPWEFYSNEISNHSPHDGESPIDLLYVPKVRDALKKAGHDGVFTMDTLENTAIPTWIPFDKGQVHHVGSDVIDDAQNFAGGGSVVDRDRQARLQNEHSQQVMKQMLRGWAAGTAGMPGDLEGLVRHLIPGVSNDSFLPTSDFYKEWLPGASEDPRLKEAADVGSWTGGMGVGAPLKAAGKGATSVLKHAGQMVDAGMHGEGALAKVLAPAQPAFVVKPKGGNWLKGSPEEALKSWKVDIPTLEPYPEGRADRVGWAVDKDTGEIYDPNTMRRVQDDQHVNNWIDKQLTRYVKNDLATPTDPVRALAEKGPIHTQPQPQIYGPGMNVTTARIKAGFPEHGMGLSETARAWEDVADKSLAGTEAKNWMTETRKERIDPRVGDDSMVYGTSGGITRDLGFNHLIDELHNSVRAHGTQQQLDKFLLAAKTPEDQAAARQAFMPNLPAQFHINPESLSRVSVPQMVQHVADLNKWRAEQKVAANAVKANNAATVLHKDYPDKGFKWVELREPDPVLPEGYTLQTDPRNGLRVAMHPQGYPVSSGATDEEAIRLIDRMGRRGELEDALKYEGDTMGHCVGGYCDDVANGRSRIFSLRDSKTGEPHVTIETAPGLRQADPTRPLQSYDARKFTPDLMADYQKAFTESGRHSMHYGSDFWPWLEKSNPETYAEATKMGDPSIVQIKGKGNKAPIAKYQPFAQDFVKSGQWSDVGDIQNAGLVEHPTTPNKYLTNDEYDIWKAGDPNEQNFAKGGHVHGLINIDTYVHNEPIPPQVMQALVKRFGQHLTMRQVLDTFKKEANGGHQYATKQKLIDWAMSHK